MTSTITTTTTSHCRFSFSSLLLFLAYIINQLSSNVVQAQTCPTGLSVNLIFITLNSFVKDNQKFTMNVVIDNYCDTGKKDMEVSLS